jgi:hypothetical protein
MDEERRRILTQVARGELDPSEAADRLAALDERYAKSGEPTQEASREERQSTWSPPPLAPAGDEVRRIRIEGQMLGVTVVGDPDVREAVAQGPHSAHRDGDTLVIASEVGEGFSFSPFGSGRRGRSMMIGGRSVAESVNIRVNPNLPLDVELRAGTLTVKGVHAPIRADVAAGSAKLRDVTAPIDIEVSAGSVNVSGRITSGTSRIRCDAGAVNLKLDPSSSLRIRAESGLGKVRLPGYAAASAHRGGSGSPWNLLSGTQETVIGDGDGELDIEVNLGAVHVSESSGEDWL